MLFSNHIDLIVVLAGIMGTDVTPNGLKFQFTDRYRPIANRQLEMQAAGQDPKDIDLDSVKGGKGRKSSRGQTF